MNNYDDENLKVSLDKSKDVSELEKTNEMPVIDLSLDSETESKADFSENYYDFSSSNNENLNKPLDLNKKIQDDGVNNQINQNNTLNSNDYNYYTNTQNSFPSTQNNYYNNNSYNNGLNSNTYSNYNNQHNQNKPYNNYQSQHLGNISKAPIVLGVLSGISAFLSFLGSLIVLVYIIVSGSSTVIEPELLFDDVYTRTMLLSIIPIWVFASIVGVAAIVFAIISIRYVKVATIGFLICTIMFFLLMFPGYAGTFLSFILCLFATIVSYRNMKRFAHS